MYSTSHASRKTRVEILEKLALAFDLNCAASCFVGKK
jgi:hypothetical protein